MTPRARMQRALAVVVIILSWSLPTARPESKPPSPLTGKVELRFQRCRSGAPIPIVWEIEWNEQAIAQGNLDYEVEDANQVLVSLRLSDIVLSPGKNVFNAMLPALSIYNRAAPVTVRARFVSGTRSFEFDEQSLRVPNRFDQWFNVGVVSGGLSKSSAEEGRLLDAIRWERLLPPNDARDRSTTVDLDVPSVLLPADPLTLCNFDAVVLLPAALVEIRADQADALKKWVTAGGSLCVIAGGGLAVRHADLLNDLLAESGNHEAFAIDHRGYLAPGEEAVGEIVSARKGLGRVVMLRQALWQTLKPDAKEWLAASGFLMKIRQQLADRQDQPPGFDFIRKMISVRSKRSAVPGANSPANGGRPASANARPLSRVPAQPGNPQGAPTIQLVSPGMPGNAARTNVSPAWRLRYDPTVALRSDLAPPALATLSGLFQFLMPANVQMVPLGLIGAVLAAYVLAIGPIDYFLLGLLRMRRLTWVLFPLVTIAFAGSTLWLSRWYLGTNDSRQAIEINDVVKGGSVARKTRIELLFLSQERNVTTEVQNGTFARVGFGLATDMRRFASAVPNAPEHLDVDQSSYVGRFPNRYLVAQGVPQWSPTVNRFFWIDPKPVKFEKSRGADPTASFDWDDPGDWKTPAGRLALAQRIRRAFGDEACAVLYHRDGPNMVVPILNSFGILRQLSGHSQPLEIQTTISDVVDELSFRSPEKLFSLVSQISPNGSPELDDLAILDGASPRESLLVIGVERGSDLVLYRRLYAGGP